MQRLGAARARQPDTRAPGDAGEAHAAAHGARVLELVARAPRGTAMCNRRHV